MSKHGDSGGGAVYGIGLIGVFVHYMQNSHNAADVLLGIVKSIVWPGILTYKLFELLNI